jgi:hypothetical protein
MEWEGDPEAFAMSYPYVVAFEPGFVEIRNIVTVRGEGLAKNVTKCEN